MKVTEKPVKLLLPLSPKAEARKKRASARIMLWRLRNPERRREQLKKQQNEIHEWLNLYKLDKGCIDCGYKGHHVALELDHVKGEKTRRFNGPLSYKWLREEIKKCDVRCANCHAIRHYKERHP